MHDYPTLVYEIAACSRPAGTGIQSTMPSRWQARSSLLQRVSFRPRSNPIAGGGAGRQSLFSQVSTAAVPAKSLKALSSSAGRAMVR